MCGVHETTDYSQILLWEAVHSLEKLIFNSFLLCEDLVVLKELIFHSFFFGKLCDVLKITDLSQFLL